MKLHESGENYLKAILILNNKYGYVRSVDIAEWLGVSKPSVSNAIRSLGSGGYIWLDKNKMIRLTDAGKKAAENVYERYSFLTKALIAIGVDPKVAERDACKVEHDLSEESYDRLRSHLESIVADSEKKTACRLGQNDPC